MQKRRSRVAASWSAGAAPSVALPAPIKIAAGELAAMWAPAVYYFKDKAIKWGLKKKIMELTKCWDILLHLHIHCVPFFSPSLLFI